MRTWILWQALAPERIEVRDLGESLEKRPIRAIVFDPGAGVQDSIVVLGTQHAREWISPMVVSCLADVLARRYESDADVRHILDRVEIAPGSDGESRRLCVLALHRSHVAKKPEWVRSRS